MVLVLLSFFLHPSTIVLEKEFEVFFVYNPCNQIITERCSMKRENLCSTAPDTFRRSRSGSDWKVFASKLSNRGKPYCIGLLNDPSLAQSGHAPYFTSRMYLSSSASQNWRRVCSSSPSEEFALLHWPLVLLAHETFYPFSVTASADEE
jgi:hypothetical protein